MPSEPEILFTRDGPGGLRLTMPGDPQAVREGLQALFGTLMLRNLPSDGRGTAELVLAEVLNNIVEHAYSRHPGEIELSLSIGQDGLRCQIVDTGLPMPGGQPPAGKAPDPADLPEGGFGWHLIRSLSQDLTYRREGSRNHLSFRLET